MNCSTFKKFKSVRFYFCKTFSQSISETLILWKAYKSTGNRFIGTAGKILMCNVGVGDFTLSELQFEQTANPASRTCTYGHKEFE